MLIRTDITKIGDPYILRVANSYYMYLTSLDGRGYMVWKSDDLHAWKCLGMCFDPAGSWAKSRFWAPEVIFHNGKYKMYFTASARVDECLRIGVAVSDKPEGPFRQLRDEPMFDPGYGVLDASVFIDDDGTGYLYFSRAAADNVVNGVHTSTICVAKLDESMTALASEPKELLTPTEPYECRSLRLDTLWSEGPFVIKHNGKYYLTYSVNFFKSKDYCICLAVSDSPMGEFVKSAKNPLLSYVDGDADFSGPGHNAFFTDADGKLKIVFHIHSDASDPSGDRRAVIADAQFVGDELQIVL